MMGSDAGEFYDKMLGWEPWGGWRVSREDFIAYQSADERVTAEIIEKVMREKKEYKYERDKMLAFE